MNGKKVGEFTLDAARAGEHGTPVIMTSGDDKFCAEARSVVRNVVAVQVKEGISRESGKLLPMAQAQQKIHAGALKAVKNYRRIKPLKIRPPVTFRLELVNEIPAAFMRPGVKIIDGRTYEVTGRNVEETVNSLIY